MDEFAKKLCAEFAAGDAKRDAGLSTPEGIERFDGISYGQHAAHTLDVYRPKGAGVLPLIVSVHGGGYVYGSTEVYQFYCMDLALRGFAVVSFNYRLAPEFKFPTPLFDLNRVMEWVQENAEKYSLDLENIFMLGDSAGAQLASQYAAISTNAEYAEIMGIRPTGLAIRALGLNCGMYDLHSHLQNKEGPNGVMSCYFTDSPEVFGEKLDVLSFITAGYPPAYLISSPGDFLLANCRPMAELLRSRGVEAEYRIYGGEDTGHVFHVDIRSEVGRQANDDEISFFINHIK